MEKIEKFVAKYYLAIIILGSIPAILALFVEGYYGASDDLHVAWLGLFNETVKLGQFPPRYVPSLSFGFGYPLFNFVFPLPFYIGEIFVLLGFGLVGSIKSVFVVSFVASSIVMYKFLRTLVKPLVSLAGAVVYLYAPYRATEVYVRGAVGEALSFVFLPLLFLGFVKILKNETKKGICLTALALAFLILSHNIVSYMFLGFLVLALVFFRQKFVQIITAGILGLVGSSFFWVPALLESNLVKYDTVFSYFDHFPTLKQLITPYFGYGASVPGPGDGMSFFLGGINILLVLTSTYVLIKSFRRKLDLSKTFLLFSFAAFLISVFMMNHRSSVVWDALPLLPYFQFPWRFLTATTFFTTLMVISLSRVKKSGVLAFFILVFGIVLNFSYFKPQDNLGRGDDYYLTRYTTLNGTSPEYKSTKEEYLRLPENSEARPATLYPDFYGDNIIVLSNTKMNLLEYKALVKSNGGVVSVNKYYFPGWEVNVDGQKVDIVSGQPFGQISFDIPAGEHTLHYFYSEPLYKRLLDVVSFATLLSLMLILVSKDAKKDSQN